MVSFVFLGGKIELNHSAPRSSQSDYCGSKSVQGERCKKLSSRVGMTPSAKMHLGMSASTSTSQVLTNDTLATQLERMMRKR